jgi:hypothetical protein
LRDRNVSATRPNINTLMRFRLCGQRHSKDLALCVFYSWRPVNGRRCISWQTGVCRCLWSMCPDKSAVVWCPRCQVGRHSS